MVITISPFRNYKFSALLRALRRHRRSHPCILHRCDFPIALFLPADESRPKADRRALLRLSFDSARSGHPCSNDGELSVIADGEIVGFDDALDFIPIRRSFRLVKVDGFLARVVFSDRRNFHVIRGVYFRKRRGIVIDLRVDHLSD